MQLGLPTAQPYQTFPASLPEFTLRTRRWNFLANATDARSIPNSAVPEEFSKEHLRVSFQTHFMQEMSDLDGIFWGQQHTYPIEYLLI
jgi:hypothetical protein